MWTAIIHIDVIIFICRSIYYRCKSAIRNAPSHILCVEYPKYQQQMHNNFVTHQINIPLPANLCVASSAPTRVHITGCMAPRQALALNIWRQAVSKLTPLFRYGVHSHLMTMHQAPGT